MTAEAHAEKIARLRDISGTNNATRTGTTVGTPAFMPTEQALGNTDQIDARTDLWALGATMFTLLIGREVHEADTVNKLLPAAMTRPAPPVCSILPTVTPRLAAIVDQALAFDQKDRFQDARSMQIVLRGLAETSWIIPAPFASFVVDPTTSPRLSTPHITPARARDAPRAAAGCFCWRSPRR